MELKDHKQMVEAEHGWGTEEKGEEREEKKEGRGEEKKEGRAQFWSFKPVSGVGSSYYVMIVCQFLQKLDLNPQQGWD